METETNYEPDYTRDIFNLKKLTDYTKSYTYDGLPGSTSAKVDLLSVWKTVTNKFKHVIPHSYAFNIVFSEHLIGSAQTWASTQDFGMDHADFLHLFNAEFTSANEDLLTYDKAASFKFSLNNFGADFVKFSNLVACMDGYSDNDRSFLQLFYHALPNSIRNLLPAISYNSSRELYSAISSVITNKPALGFVQREDPDAMIIDNNVVDVADVSNVAFGHFLDQVYDIAANADSSDSMTVDLDAIRTNVHRFTTDKNRSSRNCFYCNKPGHFIRNCHKRKMNAQHSRYNSNSNSNSNDYEVQQKPFRP